MVQPVALRNSRVGGCPRITGTKGDEGICSSYLGERITPMKRLFVLLVVGFAPAIASAANAEWRRVSIAQTGATVEIPVWIFTEDAGAPDGGTERRFLTKDRQADLTLQSVPNPQNDSPAKFLQKRGPPAAIQYKRVTPEFFAVSSIRGGRTWYNRCNRGIGYMNCVLINYPAAEERRWDGVVTRISLSLGR